MQHQVFVYGTLLKGEYNERFALNAKREAASVVGTLYHTGWSFPAFVKEGSTIVKGELLTVDDEGFKSMDRLEGYPRFYRREEIEVKKDSGEKTKAWVYIMNQLPQSAFVIKSGDWRKR